MVDITEYWYQGTCVQSRWKWEGPTLVIKSSYCCRLTFIESSFTSPLSKACLISPQYLSILCKFVHTDLLTNRLRTNRHHITIFLLQSTFLENFIFTLSLFVQSSCPLCDYSTTKVTLKTHIMSCHVMSCHVFGAQDILIMPKYLYNVVSFIHVLSLQTWKRHNFLVDAYRT